MNTKKTEAARSSYIIFFPLLFLVLMLEIVHLPAVIAPYRPDFMALLLIFFAIIDPLRINVGIAWITGFLLDLLTGAPMGINGLAMAFQVWVVVSQFRHFSQFAVWQQMCIIGIVNFIAHMCVYWIEHLIGQTSSVSNYSYQTLSTIVFWPITLLLCDMMWNVFNIQAASLKKEKEL